MATTVEYPPPQPNIDYVYYMRCLFSTSDQRITIQLCCIPYFPYRTISTRGTLLLAAPYSPKPVP